MIMKVNKGVEEYLKQVTHMKLLPRKRAGLWRASGSVLQAKTTRNTSAGVRMSANKRPESIVVAIQHSGCVASAILTTLWRLEVMGLISLFWGACAQNYESTLFLSKNKLELPQLILLLSAFNGLSVGLNRSDSWCVVIVLLCSED